MFTTLHSQALEAAKKLRLAETNMIDILQEIEACRGYRELGYTSLFAYTVQALKLSEALAYHLILVGRKAVEVPELKLAIASGELTLSKAKTIVAVLNPENKDHWLAAAKQSTARELERLVRKESGQSLEKKLSLSAETLDLLLRVQEVLAQKQKAPVKLAEAVELLAKEFLQRHDPVEKAERAVRKNLHVESKIRAKHQTFQRTRGQCQFRHSNGTQCANRQWLDIHHIHPKSEGGDDSPTNLTLLCQAHHQMVHEKLKIPAQASRGS